MGQKEALQLFEDKKIRTSWSEIDEKWYFSIVDIVGVLTDQPTPKRASTYWSVLKTRLKEEGAEELLTNCKRLKSNLARASSPDRTPRPYMARKFPKR